MVIGDATVEETEKAILSKANVYDLIIDDGSHRSSDIVKSFVRYFPHIRNGGLFVVERFRTAVIGRNSKAGSLLLFQP